MRNSRVQVLDKDFQLVNQWGAYGNRSGQFSLTFPGIDIDENAGLVVVVDKLFNKCSSFDQKGKFVSTFGSKGPWRGTNINTRGLKILRLILEDGFLYVILEIRKIKYFLLHTIHLENRRIK